MCPLLRKSSKSITANMCDYPVDPWFCGVFIMDATTDKCQMSSKGPPYKVDIIVA